jgi:hypothetical protein
MMGNKPQPQKDRFLPGMDGEKFAVVLPHLRKLGFTLPIHLCAMASNGAVFACSYEPGESISGVVFPKVKFLAKGSLHKYKLPIAVMFMDAATGYCATAVFEDPGLQNWHWQ